MNFWKCFVFLEITRKTKQITKNSVKWEFKKKNLILSILRVIFGKTANFGNSILTLSSSEKVLDRDKFGLNC